MRAIIITNRSRLLPFFLGAFGICRLCVGVVVLNERQALSLGSPLLALALKGLGDFGPTLSVLGVTAFFLGSRGVRSWLAPGLRWRVGVVWYAVALLLPFMMLMARVGLAALLHGATSAPWAVLPPTLVGLLSAVVAPLGEEFGWRGFALPRLEMRFGAIRASLFLGSIWGIWHLPFFLLPNASEAGLPFILFLGGCIAETFIYTWLFNGSGGSVLICMVFHAATNVALQIVPVSPDTQGGHLLPYLLFTAVEGVIALVVILVMRRRRRTTLSAKIGVQV
jgi:membrane protease YdiL (CAAX protease family)